MQQIVEGFCIFPCSLLHSAGYSSALRVGTKPAEDLPDLLYFSSLTAIDPLSLYQTATSY